MPTSIRLEWQGPYRYFEDGIQDIPNEAAVYLWTVEVEGRHRVIYVGETRTLRQRWSDHLSLLLGGRYEMYDPIQLRQGKRARCYGYEDASHHMTKFTEDVALTAFENARLYRLWYALLPLPEFAIRSNRMGVESAILCHLQRHDHLKDIITNGKLSVGSRNTRKVCCVNHWPNGIAAEGLAHEQAMDEYGELE